MSPFLQVWQLFLSFKKYTNTFLNITDCGLWSDDKINFIYVFHLRKYEKQHFIHVSFEWECIFQFEQKTIATKFDSKVITERFNYEWCSCQRVSHASHYYKNVDRIARTHLIVRRIEWRCAVTPLQGHAVLWKTIMQKTWRDIPFDKIEEIAIKNNKFCCCHLKKVQYC